MSHISWSSPVRRRGGNELTPLPNEIYSEIFQFLKPISQDAWLDESARRDLGSLVLVCRFFSALVLPWLLENMTFVGGNTAPLSVKAASSLCRKILAKEESALLLAGHVKRWRFVGPTAGSLWTPAFLTMYFEAMKSMANLTEFALFKAQVTKAIIKGWLQIPSLRSLVLHQCQVEEQLSLKNLRKFQKLRLKTLFIQSTMSYGPSCFNPWIDLSSLDRLQVGLYDEEPPLSVPKEDLPLTYLEALATTVDPCLKLLERCPKLKTLRLPNLYPCPLNQDWAKVLDSCHIPGLVELEAPWEYCLKLVPGRRITTLKLVDMDPKKNPEILQHSASWIKHLRIPHHAYINLPFLDRFSSLQSLEISVSSKHKVMVQEIISSISNTKPNHPELKLFTLSLDGEEAPPLRRIFDEASQEDKVLKTIESTFPTIERVKLLDHKVRRTYYRLCVGMWERGSIFSL